MITWKELAITLKTERIVFDVTLTYIIKFFYHTFLPPLPKSQSILFIVGCQRSGTSLMNRVFTRDFNVSVYREASKLSSDDKEKRLRLNSFEKLAQEFSKNKAPLIVLKPLVESHNTTKLLDFFPNSKALWMYRHYRDVASSNLKRFNLYSGKRALKLIIDNDQTNWRSEGASDYTRSVVAEHFTADMDPYDASALFWFARNQLFFDLKLDQNPQALMCRYKDLVTQTNTVMRRIYQFTNTPYPFEGKNVQEINTKSIGKGNEIKLSPAIETVCNAQLDRLDQAYAIKIKQFSEGKNANS